MIGLILPIPATLRHFQLSRSASAMTGIEEVPHAVASHPSQIQSHVDPFSLAGDTDAPRSWPDQPVLNRPIPEVVLGHRGHTDS
jgi:hypothetical protein